MSNRGSSYITVHYQNPIVVDESVFSPIGAFLIVPDGTKTKYEAATGWNAFPKIIEASSHNSRRILNVTTAGTLPDLISEEEKYSIEELTLTGELNGIDLWFLHCMAGVDSKSGNYTGGYLRYLDISNVRIVEGGNADFYSQSDVIGELAFADAIGLEEIEGRKDPL